MDENQYYVTETDDGVSQYSWENVWGIGTLEEEATEFGNDGCGTFEIDQYDDSCALPVMFRKPTGMKFEQTERDREDPGHREVTVISKASPSAFIDLIGNGDSSDFRNPAPGDLALMIRADYPGLMCMTKLGEARQSSVAIPRR